MSANSGSNSDSIWETLKRINFKKGDILFAEGDPGFFFYILQEGKVEVFKRAADGEKKILGIAEPGQPLGEFALITESLRSASARAISDGYAIEVSEEGYKRLLADLPEWAIAVFKSLIRRLKDANELLNASSRDGLTSPEEFDLFLDDTTQRIPR
jgi:CRP-like cAMP-binding protein